MQSKQRITSPQILSRIMAQLERGRFRPGDRIIPRLIAKDTGTSTIPVREALFQLVGCGVLIERHREGFYVAGFDAEMLRRLLSEHGRTIDLLLELWQPGQRRLGPAKDLWHLFDVIARQSADRGLAGLQCYLAMRLLPARRSIVEPGTGPAYARSMWEALRAKDTAAARSASRIFHEQACDQTGGALQRMAAL